MRTAHPQALDMTFAVCGAIDEQDGVRQAIDLFRQSGGRFVYQGGLDPHPAPQSQIWESGTLFCDIRHPALSPDELSGYDVERLGPAALQLPRANFACFPREGKGTTPRAEWLAVRAIKLGQATWFEDEQKVDPVALGLLRAAGEMYALFRPRFGYIDESAAGEPPLETYLGDEVPRLFWVNIFGPEYVTRLGRDFLRNAPGWRLVEFPDGGIMHIASESYMSWWHADFTALRDYFRQKLPDIDIYRAEPLPEGG